MIKKQNAKMAGTVFLGGISGTGGTPYSGVAFVVPPCKCEGGTGGTTLNSVVLS